MLIIAVCMLAETRPTGPVQKTEPGEDVIAGTKFDGMMRPVPRVRREEFAPGLDAQNIHGHPLFRRSRATQGSLKIMTQVANDVHRISGADVNVTLHEVPQGPGLVDSTDG